VETVTAQSHIYRNYECLIPAAIFAAVHETALAAGVVASTTDTTVHPITAAIKTENSVFSEMRLKRLFI